jgi:hypothetical protein
MPKRITEQWKQQRNPLRVYEHLFTNKGIAPQMLWVPQPLGAQQQDWRHFIAPGGPLGHLFAPDAPQPKYVAASSYQQGWQQRIFFQRCLLPMPGFNVGIWTIRSAPYGWPAP